MLLHLLTNDGEFSRENYFLFFYEDYARSPG